MIPNQITTSRFDSWLRRALRIRDRSVVPALATELLAVTGFELDRPEHYWAGETAQYHFGILHTSGAAQAGIVQLLNPAGSGNVVVVTDIWLDTILASDFVVRMAFPGSALGAAPLTVFGRRDSRIPANTQTQVNEGNSAGAPANSPVFRVNVGQYRHINMPWVLYPNSSIEVHQVAVNTSMYVHMAWYERPFEPSEETGG